MKYSIDRNKILKLLYILMLLSVIIDTTGEVLHFKIFFFSFLFIGIRDIKIKRLTPLFIFILIYTISFTYAIVSNKNLDFTEAFRMLYASLALLLLCFVENKEFENIYYFSKFCIYISIISIVILVLVIFSPILRTAITGFVKRHNDFIWIILGRELVGHKIYGVFYPSALLCTVPLALYSSLYFYTKKRKFLLYSLLLFTCLFQSCTRANMLSGLVIILFSFYAYLFYNKKEVSFAGIVVSVAMLCVIVLFIFFITDTGEKSLQTKQLHFVSYMELFDTNPIEFLLIGNGPRSIMYSYGSHKFLSHTELSYLDLIKDFGLIQTVVYMLVVFYPVFLLFKTVYMPKFIKYTLIISYLLFLFIEGTNPYLFSLSHFFMMGFIYSLSNENCFRKFLIREGCSI